jgi:very-short-patch-repair endonuclease
VKYVGKKIDLTGKVYGELTVVEMLYHYNNTGRTYCRCISGNNEVIVRADALQSGATNSIKGAGKTGKPIDISGVRFGLLVAIKPTNKRSSNGSVIWECRCDCGNISEVSLGQLTRHHTLSCGCRHQSKWEMMIRDFLSSLDVDFKEQYRFEDCWNQKHSDRLPFDFYLPTHNIIIEYDGEHHFTPVKGWGGEDKFKITQQNDLIKNQYCFYNNITLLRLPYTYTEDKIKKEILNILSPVTITA